MQENNEIPFPHHIGENLNTSLRAGEYVEKLVLSVGGKLVHTEGARKMCTDFKTGKKLY